MTMKDIDNWQILLLNLMKDLAYAYIFDAWPGTWDFLVQEEEQRILGVRMHPI